MSHSGLSSRPVCPGVSPAAAPHCSLLVPPCLLQQRTSARRDSGTHTHTQWAGSPGSVSVTTAGLRAAWSATDRVTTPVVSYGACAGSLHEEYVEVTRGQIVNPIRPERPHSRSLTAGASVRHRRPHARLTVTGRRPPARIKSTAGENLRRNSMPPCHHRPLQCHWCSVQRLFQHSNLLVRVDGDNIKS